MEEVRKKINLVIDAISVASLAHWKQVDKIGDPYIRHPMRVGSYFQEKEDWDAAIVGYLHDVIEDTEYVSLLSIKACFGKTIADAVDAISRRDEESYKDYVRRCCENDIARRVKKRDVQDNMLPWRNWKNNPISRYKWTLDYIKENYDE